VLKKSVSSKPLMTVPVTSSLHGFVKPNPKLSKQFLPVFLLRSVPSQSFNLVQSFLRTLMF
jgi:hypothetical protein